MTQTSQAEASSRRVCACPVCLPFGVSHYAACEASLEPRVAIVAGDDGHRHSVATRNGDDAHIGCFVKLHLTSSDVSRRLYSYVETGRRRRMSFVTVLERFQVDWKVISGTTVDLYNACHPGSFDNRLENILEESRFVQMGRVLLCEAAQLGRGMRIELC